MFDPRNFRIVGYGHTTLTAAQALLHGVDWGHAGVLVTTGNGSAMRAGPMGLLYANDFSSLLKAAVHQGMITHNSLHCSGGSAAVATAVALAARHSMPFDARQFLADVSHAMAPVDSVFGEGIRDLLPAVLSASAPRALSAIVEFASTRLGDKLSAGGSVISSSVGQTVLWALRSFCLFPDDFMGCMGDAIRVGGDVDTTGAIAGAICGVRVGECAIPAWLRACVHDRTEYTAVDMVRIADEFYDLVCGPDTRPPPPYVLPDAAPSLARQTDTP